MASQMAKKIAFIGSGHMAEAMIGGLLAAGVCDSDALWASDPVLSMPDELNDYMGDYTDAAVAAPGRLLTTAYKVGRGFLDDSEVAAWERLGRPEPAPPAVAVAEGATPPAAPPADESAGEPLASSAEESEDAPVAPEETGSAPADRAAPGRNQG